ncbi:hypothetical protein PMAYCL1PPCAC_26481, partial [Pristionchus mayeri]
DGMCQEVVEILKRKPSMEQWRHALKIIHCMSSKGENYPALNSNHITPLIRLMTLPNLSIALETTKSVASIAGESARLRDLVLQSNVLGALKTLCGKLKNLPISFVRVLSVTFGSICSHTGSKVSLELHDVMVQCLFQLLQFQDHEVCKSAIGALVGITCESSNESAQRQIVLDSGILPLVFKHLSDDCDNMMELALSV